MTTPFKREPRYFVFKISDMRKHLSRDKFELVGSIAEKLNAGRAVEGKVPLDAVVVESDWPEYEYVWKMIEQRVTGLHEPENEPLVSMHSRPASSELHEAVDASLGIIRTNQMQSKKELTAWPCEIETADFESDTITLKMQSSDYKVSAGQHWLSTSPPDAKQQLLIPSNSTELEKQEQGEPVAWNEDQAYAWGRGCYEIAQGATTGWKLFGQLTPKEQAYWVAKAAFEKATPQPKKEQGEPVAWPEPMEQPPVYADEDPAEQARAFRYRAGWNECLEKCKAATTPQQRKPLMEWQPIETAPKNSTSILIYCPRSERKPVCEAWWAIAFEGDHGGHWQTPIGPNGRGYTILETSPTHWMPLPTPPIEAAHGIKE